jgi:hypothetical protein
MGREPGPGRRARTSPLPDQREHLGNLVIRYRITRFSETIGHRLQRKPELVVVEELVRPLPRPRVEAISKDDKNARGESPGRTCASEMSRTATPNRSPTPTAHNARHLIDRSVILPALVAPLSGQRGAGYGAVMQVPASQAAAKVAPGTPASVRTACNRERFDLRAGAGAT